MNENASQEGSAPVAEKQLANIVRGTLPRALVYMIRFEERGNKEADVARKYGTTTGKVADIVKGRNFAYIDEDYRPTPEDKDAAVAWLKQVPGYDEVDTDSVVSALLSLPEADAASAAALAEKRAAVRARNAASAPPKAEGGEKPAAKGGGTKRGGKRGGSKDVSESDAEDLMA